MTGPGTARSRPLVPVLLPLFLCLPLAAHDDPPTTDRAWEKKEAQWFEAIDSGDRVHVQNPFGNIYARFGGYENQVEILATVQRLDLARPELVVDIERVDGVLEVLVRPGVAEGGGPTSDKQAGRVDLVVFVPLGARLDARTEHDLIEAKGLRGDVVASSLTGNIRLRSIEGRIRAETTGGSISAMLVTGATDETQELTTETGEIEVHLGEDSDVEVKIATSGEISTDFSLDIEHHRFQEPGKHAVATIGEGGSLISLRSKRGRVRLLRTQKYFKPDPQNP